MAAARAVKQPSASCGTERVFPRRRWERLVNPDPRDHQTRRPLPLVAGVRFVVEESQRVRD
jgi:hypothetical protein